MIKVMYSYPILSCSSKVTILNYTVKKERKFSKAVKAQGYKESQPSKFTNLKALYLITDFDLNSGQLLEVPSRIKSFVGIFPKNQKQLRNYIDKEDWKLDDEKDIVRIFDYYYKYLK